MKKLLLGILGGISLGMLFAPKKGKDLRDDLAKSDNKLKTVANTFQEMAKTASNEIKEYLKTEEAQAIIKKGKTAVKTVAKIVGKKGGEVMKKGKVTAKKVMKNLQSK